MRPVEIYYRDYKSVNGLMVPYVLESTAQGARQSHKMTIESVAINSKLEDSLFAKPALRRREKDPEITTSKSVRWSSEDLATYLLPMRCPLGAYGPDAPNPIHFAPFLVWRVTLGTERMVQEMVGILIWRFQFALDQTTP
jgi:hypothetical protein